MLMMLQASAPETLSTISRSTPSHFPQRRCSPAHSSPLPCQTEALQGPSTALASPHEAWLDLSTTLADLISTACRGLSATASPRLQTSLTDLTAGSSRLASPKMGFRPRRMGKDLYQPQEPSSPPLPLEETARKSLQGHLLNRNMCLTSSLARERQHRAISAIICCRAQVAMIPLLQAVQSYLASTSSTLGAYGCWWKTKELDRSLSLFFVQPVATGEGQMGWGTCLKEEP